MSPILRSQTRQTTVSRPQSSRLIQKGPKARGSPRRGPPRRAKRLGTSKPSSRKADKIVPTESRTETVPDSITSRRQNSYKQLELENKQIRILHLLPAKFDDPIQTRLSTAYLDDKPYYEAVSYVWGDPNVCMDITVDGHKRSVTINLYRALRNCMSFLTSGISVFASLIYPRLANGIR